MDERTQDLLVARHLAAISREAAGRAYEADAGTAGKITTWLITVLTTLHAGGLLAALQSPQNLARPYEAQCALLVGLVATLAGGALSLIHFNFLAERRRQEMYLEVEGVKEVVRSSAESGRLAHVFDRAASAALVASVLSLLTAGIFAI
ncbi:MAG: hypothetical protein KAF42_03775 [Sphingopyxis terrae]|nr:hypothetical protein [Sphingopyxis terrae]